MCLIGAFPPPVMGPSLVHERLRSALAEAGVTPIVINLAPRALSPGIGRPLSRLPRVAKGLVRALAMMSRERRPVVYIGLSGGFGQLFDGFFIVLARLCRASLFIHHHGYAYLRRPALRTRILLLVAGQRCTHIVLCETVGDRLTALYPRCQRVFVLSGAAFIDHPQLRPLPRAHLRTVGFLSNISIEKGVLDYLEVVRRLAEADDQIRSILAGPFMSSTIEATVRARMKDTPTLEYIGPVHGIEKKEFFDMIDVLVFPTRDEAEGLVIHEAMAMGVPVIARGHGCIPSVIAPASGLAIPISADFVGEATVQIREWQRSKESFTKASTQARDSFSTRREASSEQLRRLVSELQAVAPADGK